MTHIHIINPVPLPTSDLIAEVSIIEKRTIYSIKSNAAECGFS
jgi:hypothetical protein